MQVLHRRMALAFGHGDDDADSDEVIMKLVLLIICR